MAHIQSSSPLRAITVRLSLTPAKQLPHITSFLANDIGRCTLELSSPSSHSKNGSESAVLVHKLKTQISSLLQGKQVEERWSAIVLIKATVEAGGWEVLQNSGTWVRGMLAILGRPDPDATKQLCILALTRIFSLAQGQQNLTREIVTPSLPAFFNHCLQIITRKAPKEGTKEVNSQSPLLDTVLQAFAHIMPNHPSACRPFVPQIQTLLSPLLAPTPSNRQQKSSSSFKEPSVSNSSSDLAQRIYPLLLTCAPKNTASEEYSKSIKALVAHIHRTADHVFRAVVEEPPSQSSTVDPRAYDEVVSDKCDDDFGLPGWRGIYAGAERLAGLMHILQAYIPTVGAMPYNLPVGSIWRCIERLLGVVGPVPSIYREQIGQLAQNPEIDRDERESLWSTLPLIHVASIETMSVLISRLGLTSGSISSVAMNQLIWSFKACGSESQVRKSIYITLAQILKFSGPATSQATVKSMAPLIRACCKDVLPAAVKETSTTASPLAGANKQSNNASMENADSYLKSSTGQNPTQGEPNELVKVARSLLPLFLSKLPTQYLSSSVRTQIDRTAILTYDKETMLASVLHPPQKRGKGKDVNSIMPFVARAHPGAAEVETLIRPRMPVIPSRRRNDGVLDSDDEGSAHQTHDVMMIDQNHAAEVPNGNRVGQYNEDQVQSASPKLPIPLEDGTSVDPNAEIPIISRDQGSPSILSLSKRPRAQSPTPDDLSPDEPPSKRLNLNPLAPQTSSLPPVTVMEDKVLLDPNPIPSTEDAIQDLPIQAPDDADGTAGRTSSPSANPLDKGKGKATEENDDDEDRLKEGRREREEREDSFIGSETPEINTELNPALFESSDEEDDDEEDEEDEEDGA